MNSLPEDCARLIWKNVFNECLPNIRGAYIEFMKRKNKRKYERKKHLLEIKKAYHLYLTRTRCEIHRQMMMLQFNMGMRYFYNYLLYIDKFYKSELSSLYGYQFYSFQ